MIHIKRWIPISVFLIILLVTINVDALSYSADDTATISSQYHDFFNNYFSNSFEYKYFPYECDTSTYNRTCYYGIDNNNNFINIKYNGNSYYYEKGVDNNFSVSGNNIITRSGNNNLINTYAIVFIGLVILVMFLV